MRGLITAAIALHCLLAPLRAEGGLDADLEAISTGEVGSANRAVNRMEERVRKVDPNGRAILERKLLLALSASDSSLAGKKELCGLLAALGGTNTVKALAPLLVDSDLSHAARLALEGWEGEFVDGVLMDAMEQTSGDVLAGIVSSLGRRQAQAATGRISELVSSEKKPIRDASIIALGKMGSRIAAEALLKIPDSLLTEDALLRCAENLAWGSEPDFVRKVFGKLESSSRSWIRLAATRGTVLTARSGGVDRIFELLVSDDAQERALALDLVRLVPRRSTVLKIVERLLGAEPEQQVVLLEALAERADESVKMPALALLRAEGAVAIAAVLALATVDSGAVVMPLAEFGAGMRPQSEAYKEVRKALARVRTEFLFADRAQFARPAIRKLLLGAVGDRKDPDAIRPLYDLATAASLEAEPSERHLSARRAAREALVQLVGGEDFPLVVDLLDHVEHRDELPGIERILGRSGGGHAAPLVRNRLLLKKFGEAGTVHGVRECILRLLGHLRGPGALELLALHLSGQDPGLVDVALKELSSWPNGGAVSILQSALSGSKLTQRQQSIAFRAFLAGLKHPSQAKPARFRKALEWASSDEDKRSVVGALAASVQPWALDLLGELRSDPVLGKSAGEAMESLRKTLESIPKLTDRLTLGASSASIHGKNASVEQEKGIAHIGNWTAVDTWVDWRILVEAPGTYEVSIIQAVHGHGGATFEIEFGEGRLLGAIEETEDWSSYFTVVLGRVEVEETGVQHLVFRPTSKPKDFVANLRGVVLARKP